MGNDSLEKQLKIVREEFPRLTLTDAIHLATALKAKCDTLKTKDSDLLGLSNNKVNRLAVNLGVAKLAITEPADYSQRLKKKKR